ncbi:MAG TPA: FtsX-like permease family protein, partial [Candidatus Alectryocaccobium stercorigallinarum]|nr:FtsX-like permease family protein [Candidatus Alectryocaccobium stercorigallinarum]
MNNGLFAKLAASNIRKNSKMYIPYLITCIITVAVFYILKSLSVNPGITEMVGADSLSIMMLFGCCITGIFAVIFLFYTNSFLLKRRKKELALFNILGMEKRHIGRTLAYESLYTALIALAAGIGIGIALDKLMFLIISRIIDAEISLGFFISADAIKTTIILFGIIFLLIFLNTIRQVHVSDPIRLMQESSAGEKEPKTKWVMAIIGLAALGFGYYLALANDNPLTAFMIFFPSV